MYITSFLNWSYYIKTFGCQASFGPNPQRIFCFEKAKRKLTLCLNSALFLCFLVVSGLLSTKFDAVSANKCLRDLLLIKCHMGQLKTRSRTLRMKDELRCDRCVNVKQIDGLFISNFSVKEEGMFLFCLKRCQLTRRRYSTTLLFFVFPLLIQPNHQSPGKCVKMIRHG